MKTLSRPVINRTCWALTLIATGFLLSAAYIPVKAALAQSMLSDAWQKTLTHNRPARPWPWADMHPIARLQVPAHDIDQIVLSGDRGNSLAFGPGLHPASDLDKSSGMIVISGHRDTHFHFLQKINRDDMIELQAMNGKTTGYRIDRISVIDIRNTQLRMPDDGKWLALVTCYPFNTIQDNPSLRYVVMAEALT